MDERTRMGHRLRVSAVSGAVYPLARRKSFLASVIAITLLAPSWALAHAQGHPSEATATALTPATEVNCDSVDSGNRGGPPRCPLRRKRVPVKLFREIVGDRDQDDRSEERRVGKEC